jgi:sulfate permease, SulP family
VQIILSSRGSGVWRHPDRVATCLLTKVRPDLIVPLLPAAVTVAMLAAIESLLSAVVADSMSGDRHNSNVELLAQGVANLAVPSQCLFAMLSFS